MSVHEVMCSCALVLGELNRAAWYETTCSALQATFAKMQLEAAAEEAQSQAATDAADAAEGGASPGAAGAGGGDTGAAERLAAASLQVHPIKFLF